WRPHHPSCDLGGRTSSSPARPRYDSATTTSQQAMGNNARDRVKCPAGLSASAGLSADPTGRSAEPTGDSARHLFVAGLERLEFLNTITAHLFDLPHPRSVPSRLRNRLARPAIDLELPVNADRQVGSGWNLDPLRPTRLGRPNEPPPLLGGED